MIKTILDKAHDEIEQSLPGYNRLQRVQPI